METLETLLKRAFAFANEIPKICRLCMSTDGEMEPLAYDESGDYLLQKIFECTSVQVTPLAGFPSNLCTICESRLDDLYLFRWQCIKNDELINRLSEELNKSSIPRENQNDATQRTVASEAVTGNNEDVKRIVEKEQIIETNPSTNETIDGDDLDGSSDYELLEVKLEEDEDEDHEDGQSYIVVLEQRSPSPDEERDLQQHTIVTDPLEPPKSRPKVNTSVHSVVHDRLCPYCPATFRTASRLMFHINTHTGKKPYVCKVCNKAFHSANNRKVHMKLHDKDQHHQCAHCPARFAQFHQLEVHIRTHTGERPYVCPVCEKAFHSVKNKNKHMKVHNKDQYYQCPVSHCPANFARSSQLQTHINTHTGEKPYMCRVCDKRFHSSHNLRVHRKIHNRNQQHHPLQQ